ncbi:MAG TPA: NAD-dependent epimerase/dehydratase family protein, partial [Kofleriaceae bacterium]|nr:NAD-dependent epimerase/dehydratase family protein [Kofleriaceae bacterium]
VADVRDPHAVGEAVAGARQVFHLAAQAGTAPSLRDPVADFDINARGTLNILEAIRRLGERPPLVYTSSSRVYGDLDDLSVVELATRYAPADGHLAASGISESRPLSPSAPCACSKSAADQYVIDYGRTFGLPAVALRVSCVYGPFQRGDEDQGWIAQVMLAAALHDTVTIFGDGKQVRDVLFIDDLVRALVVAAARAPELAGQAFNVGGGPHNTTTPIELIALCRELMGGQPQPQLRYAVWRAHDPRYYVSSIARFHAATGWSPKVDMRSGLVRLHTWLERNLVPALRQRRARLRGGGDATAAAGGRKIG